MHRSFRRTGFAPGFTLVEMISVIAITAIVAGMVAVFLRLPLQIYQDAQRRAGLTDTADAAFTFMKREIQGALPNSIRVTSVGAVYYLEMLATRTAGRYRADSPSPLAATGANTCPDGNADGLADENVLQFGVSDTCFTTLGSMPAFSTIVPNSDFVVVYNLGAGFSGGDAYAGGPASGGNKSLLTSVALGTAGENVVRFQANTFTLESPGRRFHVISGPVTYVCDPGARTLTRVSGYPIAAAQPTPPAGTSVLIAQDVAACAITYDQNVVNQRNSLVSMTLQLSDTAGAATVNLFQQIQVSNVP